MTFIEITPLQSPVKATLEMPGSKSYTNRALIMAALTKGKVSLYNPLYSEDTEAMIGCLRTLGLKIETHPVEIIIHDDISIIKNNPYQLYAKDSGTTIRFLLALLCLTPGTKVLTGTSQLKKRPIKDLVEALRSLGAHIEYLEKEGQPPLKIYPSSLRCGSQVTLNASLSSQFFSALLMIAPLLNGVQIKRRGELISTPYIEMTLSALREWSISVTQDGQGNYIVHPGQSYKKTSYQIEGDFSSSGYFFAIAALTGSTLSLKNLNPSSLQADRKFLDILVKMGNEMVIDEQGITFLGKQICPLCIDMQDCPDQVQTLAVMAAFAKGITKISGVRSLRLKETERVQALKNELAKMGIKTEDTLDTLTIYGGSPRAAAITTHGDHRMAMAFAVAGIKLPGMKIYHPEVVNKSFPTFWDKLEQLRK